MPIKDFKDILQKELRGLTSKIEKSLKEEKYSFLW